jgi:PAS domain S-box-containing protein
MEPEQTALTGNVHPAKNQIEKTSGDFLESVPLTADAHSMSERQIESEKMFRSIVENSHAGIFIIDSSFKISYANCMLSDILDYSLSEIVGSDFRRFLDEPSRITVAERYRRRQLGQVLPSRYEFNFYRQDGELRQAELSAAVVKDATGSVITVGQMLDITERKKAEAEIIKTRAELEMRVAQRTAELQNTNLLLQKEIEQRKSTQEILRRSEIKHRHIVENANSIILEMDTEGKVIFLNEFGLRFFGFQEDEIVGRSVVGTIVAPVDSAGQNLVNMIQEIVTDPVKYASNENENIKRNGERVWIVWTNQPIYDAENRLKEILCVGIDHTHQKLAEQVYAEQLKEKVTFEERNRLARDLHDAVSQTLFSTSLIAEVLPALWERNISEGRKRLEEIRQLTRGALAEMRTLLLELRPAALADAELGDLLRQLGESVTGRSRIPVKVSVEGRCAPAVEVKIGLYRIAQEALNNVAKHSGASLAGVSLKCEPDKIELIIRDNGKGFDSHQNSPGSLGLNIMQERAKNIGADLSITSEPGISTTVNVIWPKKQRRDSNG